MVRNDRAETLIERRDVLKRAGLTAGVLAVGAGSSVGTAAAQNDQSLVFAYDFQPGETFDVIARLQQGTTVSVLQTVEGETIPEISRPDQFSGYVVRYDVDTDSSTGVTTFLFTRDNPLSAGDTETFGEDASMYSSQLNLLSTTLE